MSHAFPILKSLPESFRSSYSLAILASLGVHGLLWAVIPMLPLSSKLIAPPQTVGLVELTPDELSRLPQASTPPVELPAFATVPSVLPPLPPPPDLSVLQQLPGATTNNKDLLKVPFQPQFQTLAPLPLSIPFEGAPEPSEAPEENEPIAPKPDG